MRFNEVKRALLEAEQPGYYTVGDSHAVAVGQGVPWINLAIGGTSAQDPRNKENAIKVTKGSVVLISVGANDAANAMKAAEQQKKPPISPNIIGDRVNSLVNLVKSQQPSKIIFLLFPNGPGRGPGLAPYYGGDYQEDVRTSIRNNLDNVEIIDLKGEPLPDGIHAGPATYARIRNDVVKKYSLGGIGNPAAAPAVEKTKDKVAAGDFTIEIPTNPVKGTEWADVQKSLLALGYTLPTHGVDGYYGPETKAAIKDFQKDNNLPTTGLIAAADVSQLTTQLAKKPEVLQNLKKSTPAEVKPKKVAAVPLKQDSVTKGKVGKLLDFIASYESKGDYNIIVGNPPRRMEKLTSAPVSAVLDFQDKYYNKQKGIDHSGLKSNAVGRYQYIRSTLQSTVDQMGKDPTTTIFNPGFQDELAIYTLRSSCSLDTWLNGKMDDSEFLDRIASVWAAFPDPQTGQSKYAKNKIDKAGLSVSSALNTLQSIRTMQA
jgi:peptidoglycan hydrolase-like protein with peptidoglycan-binding domain/lysophospholipase L1-like esterase